MSRIGILCACEKEVMTFMQNMQNTSTPEYAMHTFYSGKISGSNANDNKQVVWMVMYDR